MTYKDGKTCGNCADWKQSPMIGSYWGTCKTKNPNALTYNDDKECCDTCRFWVCKPVEFHLSDIAE